MEKRIMFVGRNKVVTEEFSPGRLGKNMIRVRHSYSLISAGTELLNLTGGNNFPRCPGYSSVGVVEKINGSSIFAVGDMLFSGGSHSSIFDLNIPIAEKRFVKINKKDFKKAAFANLGKVALHAVRKVGITAGDRVAVFGLGVVGNLTAQIAQRCSLRPVIGVDIDKFRLKIASGLGMDVINGKDKNLVETIKTKTDGGADIIMECSGSKEIVTAILKSARYNGKIGIVAGLYGLTTMDLKGDFQNNELTMVGCRRVDYSASEDSKYDRWTVRRLFEGFIRIAAGGTINVEKLITHIVSPEETPKAFMELKNKKPGYLGVIIDWNK